MTWSVGAACDHDGRTKFDAFLKDMSLGKIEAHPIPKCIGKMDLPYPNDGTIYDYMYDVSTLYYLWFVSDKLCTAMFGLLHFHMLPSQKSINQKRDH